MSNTTSISSAAPTSTASAALQISDGDLESRVARLERTNRLLSLALVGVVGIGAGAAMMAARSGAQAVAQAPPADQVRCKPVSIVLDPSRGSGRWNSTLLAVDSDGVVYSLDTSRPESVWRRFQFSP